MATSCGFESHRPHQSTDATGLCALNAIVRLRYALSLFPIREEQMPILAKLCRNGVYVGAPNDVPCEDERP